ncbi:MULTISPECIES: hypothetical protein [unclassified Bradyrhizobium]|uniref:hypothetical protein n=1 Tax=unclassified Bradyrhizobium TaxID=2631580 RepID=UPI0028EFE7A0|nr:MULTISPECIES: hypothetical protein [unclassified Bradyrhizobium]
MSDATIIAAGREAWARLKDRSRATFDDWVAVGKALQAARRECMARAKCNSPFGSSYQRHHMRDWLRENSMSDLDHHERYGAIMVVEHLGEIEAYRATLSEAERMRCNHVNTVLKHWRAGSAPQPQGPKRLQPAPPDDDDGLDDYFPWPDEARRRVMLALRASAGQPLAAQADAVLTAAIRSWRDYRALKPVSVPKTAKPAHAATDLHA